MPPIRSRRRLLAGVAAAALAAVAACTHEPTAPVSAGSTNPALSLPEANMMGEAVAADAQSELDGATLSSGTFLPGLGAPITPFGAGDAFCMPTRTPASPADADGDRVPDAVRIAFTGCGFAMGSEADTVRGTIDIVDPTPAVADRSVKTVFTDLTWVHVRDGKVRSLVVNGGRDPARRALAERHPQHRRHVDVDARHELVCVDRLDRPRAALQRELHRAAEVRCRHAQDHGHAQQYDVHRD